MRPFALASFSIAFAVAACGVGEQPPTASSVNSAGANAATASDADLSRNAGPSAATGEDTPEGSRSPWSPDGYRIIGTEPFWGGTVAVDEILYSTPENQQGERIPVTVAYEANRETYSGELRGRPFLLTLTDGPCSDGMSDNVHRFTATLHVDGETRRGCANPR